MIDTSLQGRSHPRNLVVCLDGTNNEIGKSQPTNPAAVFQMLQLRDPTRQIAYYDPGVGTMPSANARGRLERTTSRLSQLMFGAGLKTNLADAYGWLMHNWQRGDDIYLFGFSRGAYTARALAGMLQRPGLMRPGSENLIPYAVAKYATRKPADAAALDGIRQFADSFCWGTEDIPLGGGVHSPEPGREGRPDVHSVPIRYAGLWDTVEAAGIARAGELGWPFTRSMDNVATIRHAVSIDEARPPFRAHLDEPGHPDAQEVWFAGVHSDIGGTHRDNDRLSTIALKWVVDGAVDDLDLRPGAYQQRCLVDPGDALAAVHSNGRVWRLLGSRRRPIPPTARLHETVRLRRDQDAAYPRGWVQPDEPSPWTDPTWAELLRAPAEQVGRQLAEPGR